MNENPHKLLEYSVLDLAPIVAGSTAAVSFRNSLDLAQHAECWGYTRYWVAEHHNLAGVASAATSVLIGYLAAGTQRMRVGSGGIMLPNHAPLVIAEQFGTLESMYPGRIDLGLGRAPGGDGMTASALRRGLGSSGESFAQDLAELRSYFEPEAGQPVRAVPGAGLDVPIYLLGSSDFSARLAGQLGLPFAFASHFAPDFLLPALRIYRENFKPSRSLDQPYVMVGMNVIAAESDAMAQRLFTSIQVQFLNIIRGTRGQLQPPIDSMAGKWSQPEEDHVMNHMLSFSAVGSPELLRQQIDAMLDATGADEVIATAHLYDHAARLRSFELASGVFEQINIARAAVSNLAVAK